MLLDDRISRDVAAMRSRSGPGMSRQMRAHW
jgi:hypothetical protein